MKKKNKLITALIWTARVWATVVLIFILTFVVAHIYGAIFENEPSGEGFRNGWEILLFLCFPVSTITGLVIAYKRELLGGLIASSGLLVLLLVNVVQFAIRNGINSVTLADMFRTSGIFLFFILPPGLLYILYARLKKDRQTRSVI